MTTRAQQISALVKKIRPILAGQAPDVQGGALADLTAIWLAGHPPQIRNDMLDHQLRFIRRLTEVNDHLMFGDAGHPSAATQDNNS